MKQPIQPGYYNYDGGKYEPISEKDALFIIQNFRKCSVKDAENELAKLGSWPKSFIKDWNIIAALCRIK